MTFMSVVGGDTITMRCISGIKQLFVFFAHNI